MAGKAYNFDLLARKLPTLVAVQAPFLVDFCFPHLVTKTNLKAVRYHIKSKALKDFRHEFQFTVCRCASSWEWLGQEKTPAQPTRRSQAPFATRRVCISNFGAVENGIAGLEEATRIHNEILEIDPKSSGGLQVIGLRVEEPLPTPSDPRRTVRKPISPFRGNPTYRLDSGSWWAKEIPPFCMLSRWRKTWGKKWASSKDMVFVIYLDSTWRIHSVLRPIARLIHLCLEQSHSFGGSIDQTNFEN